MIVDTRERLSKTVDDLQGFIVSDHSKRATLSDNVWNSLYRHHRRRSSTWKRTRIFLPLRRLSSLLLLKQWMLMIRSGVIWIEMRRDIGTECNTKR